MKTLRLEPINTEVAVHTRDNVLTALLAERLDVLMACGGKGLCATCHVHIESGEKSLTPRSERELRTLGNLSRCDSSSRLACQARVLGEDVVVRLPEGMYIERAEDLLTLIGKRAQQDVLHPIRGHVLVAKGRIITRSRVEELRSIDSEMQDLHGQD